MSFNVVCLIFCWAGAAVLLFTGDICLTTVFVIAGIVFLKLERKCREVLARPDPWEVAHQSKPQDSQ